MYYLYVLLQMICFISISVPDVQSLKAYWNVNGGQMIVDNSLAILAVLELVSMSALENEIGT